jgi:hypothetical protein
MDNELSKVRGDRCVPKQVDIATKIEALIFFEGRTRPRRPGFCWSPAARAVFGPPNRIAVYLSTEWLSQL